MARASGLYATASKLMMQTVRGRFDDAERAVLTELLPHLDQNDLLVRQTVVFRRCGCLPCCNNANCRFSPGGRW
ncbi:MAG: hypothetical protein ACRERU_23355 [Methylococcales bacterium]